MKTRREFFAALPIVGLLFGSASAAEQPPGPLPRDLVERYRLRPAENGIDARNVLVPGEDGYAYRLTDVLDAIMKETKIKH